METNFLLYNDLDSEIKKDAPLSDLCYLSDKLTATIFNDSTVFVWEGDKCQYQINTPPDVIFKVSRILYSPGNFVLKFVINDESS